MNTPRKISVSLLTIIIIFIVGFIIGAMILTGYVEHLEYSSIPDQISSPSWSKGQYWTYSFKTPEIENAISTIVVASEDGENYLVGVDSRLDAQRHAVLNFNPMLGRIVMENLEVYEKGIPQPLFLFPLKKNKEWGFSMFNVEAFEARVINIKSVDLTKTGKTVLVEIQANAPSGEKLKYSYDESANWVRSLVFEDTSGNALLEMNLVSYGTGFAGDVYFIRGSDLFDEEYISNRGSPEVDFYNSFLDQGHPDWGPFDYLVYYYEVQTGDTSGGALVVTDPRAESQIRRSFGPNTFEMSLGSIPSESGEWGVKVVIGGESHLRLRIAGGIEYIWTV